MKTVLNKLQWISVVVLLQSCSLFTRDTSTDELYDISRQVIKSEQGIDIQIKPIPKEPKK